MLPLLVEELCRKGIEVEVATTDDDGPGRLEESQRIHPLSTAALYHYHPRTLRFYTLSAALGRWLRRHISSFDLVHVHAVFSYPPTEACRQARRHQVPYIVRPLGVLNRWGREHRRPWLKRISLSLIERPLLDGSVAIQCTSEAEAREVRETGIATRQVVIPNPLQVPFERLPRLRGMWRRRLAHLASRKWLLFLSRIDPKKGLDITLRGLSSLPSDERPVLLVAGAGDPGFERELRRLQRELGLESDVVWLGFLEKDEKWGLFCDADAFVLASYSENFGIAVAEAMGAGLPVLISDQVGLAPQVGACNAGLVVPAASDQVAASIPRILSPEARNWGRKGQEFALDHLSIESVSSKMIALYEEILQVRSGA